jgi:uncharacterized protein
MNPFSNEQIDISQLPDIGVVNYQKLELKHRTISVLTTILFITGILIAYIAVGFFQEELFKAPYLYIFISVWMLLSGFFILAAYKSYAIEGYALRSHDIIFKSGWLFRSVIVIPFNRVQHCEVNQGPLDRLMGLSGLSVFTAGGSGSDLTIRGLKPETANSLKDFIIGKTVRDEEE